MLKHIGSPEMNCTSGISYISSTESVMSTSSSFDNENQLNTHNEPIDISESDFNYTPILGSVFNTDVGRDNKDMTEPMMNTFFTSSHTTNFVHYCKLMDLCQKLGTTLEGFGLILDWAH